MTYPAALNYLNSFINYEWLNSYPYQSSFKLERIERLLQFLGNPQQNLRSIHIAGTKGKGSTCAFVANILKEAHFKVGLYTSPHLVDVRERIMILQNSEFRIQNSEKDIISKKDFSRLIEKIKPHAEKLRQMKLDRLSYFEMLTALAFLHFKEKACDFVVLETGIGGRLDATNVTFSFVSAITPISYEHTGILGSTLEKIAKEKAGIIKNRNQIVVTAPQRPAALKVIRRRAKEAGADLYEVGQDIQGGLLAQYPNLKIGLLGRHQIINAALAVGCVESLQYWGIKISSQAIRKGLKNTRWPGRLQIISRRPLIVLDAAHNWASASALKDAINEVFKFDNLILVLGICRDKDIRGILQELLPSASRIILTRTENPRAMEPEIIKRFIKKNERPIILTKNVPEAVKIAKQSAKEQDLILICGSLYLLGEVFQVKR